jgi:hypothetical protein
VERSKASKRSKAFNSATDMVLNKLMRTPLCRLNFEVETVNE